jgi:hypothetical protein
MHPICLSDLRPHKQKMCCFCYTCLKRLDLYRSTTADSVITQPKNRPAFLPTQSSTLSDFDQTGKTSLPLSSATSGAGIAMPCTYTLHKHPVCVFVCVCSDFDQTGKTLLPLSSATSGAEIAMPCTVPCISTLFVYMCMCVPLSTLLPCFPDDAPLHRQWKICVPCAHGGAAHRA